MTRSDDLDLIARLRKAQRHHSGVGPLALADLLGEAASELARVRKREAATVLPDDEVCACLHETGERKVRLYERCLRCGAFMEADYLAAEKENA